MKILMLITHKGLIIFAKKMQPQQLFFPPRAIMHQEILDQKLFEEFLRKAFVQLSKQELTIFLSPELIFSKSLPLQKDLNEAEALDNFTATVPLSLLTMAIKVIHTKQAIFFLATNSCIYNTIVAIANENGSRVLHVVPLTLFGEIPVGKTITYDMLSQFTQKKDIVKVGDFLTIKKQEEKKKTVLPLKQIILLIFCLIIFLAVLGWAAFTLKLLPLK